MRKISFWRYWAVNRTTLFAALACALLAFSMLGCNALQTTNHLRSITLGASLINGVAPTGQSGFFNLQGNGGTIQLQAIGNYSSGQTKDLTNEVTYTMIVDPVHNVDVFNNPLPAPCYGVPCPQSATQGTAEISVTGLVTSVEPATCTWEDVATDPKNPSWFYTGDYQVTVTFEGITSQPVYIPVASSAGSPVYPYPSGIANNPTAQCGPAS
jgi:hypothetical protein